jgi:hypothetical protein
VIFQYQSRAAPPAHETLPAPPIATWLPTYPDRVPHRQTIYAPVQAFAPIIDASGQPVRVSQIPVEHATQYASVLTRTSQLPVEAAFQYAVAIRWTRVSQIAVEIAYPFGCFVFVPPLPQPCPAPGDDPAGGPSCPVPVIGEGS